MARGGTRIGGKPKGYKAAKTLTKELAREALREIVMAHMVEMTAAQVAQSKGLKYLVTRDKKTGKFIRVTEAMAKQKSGLSENEEIIEVWEKDPSTPAYTDLMNRALDKPKEQEMEIKLTGEAEHIEKLLAGRQRAAEARKA